MIPVLAAHFPLEGDSQLFKGTTGESIADYRTA
nr:MAG TPA: hypothetical protein [Bacteriophage sp.]DAL09843.1 MAG TPA_asm: hypothetical protein [Caudoviricetes sp.]